MTQMKKMFIALLTPIPGNVSLKREEGQTLAEYALILALIALLVVVAIAFLKDQITALFSSIGNNI